MAVKDTWEGEDIKYKNDINIKFDKPIMEDKYKKFYELLNKENKYLKELSERMYESMFEGKEFIPPPIPNELNIIKDELKLKRDELMKKIEEKVKEDQRTKKEMTEKVFDDFFEKELKIKANLKELIKLYKNNKFSELSNIFNYIKKAQTLDELRRIVDQQTKTLPQNKLEQIQKNIQQKQEIIEKQTKQPQSIETQKQKDIKNVVKKENKNIDPVLKYLDLFKKYAIPFRKDTGIDVIPTKQEEEQVYKTRSLKPIKYKIDKVKEYQLKLTLDPKIDTSFPIDGLWGVKSQQRWKMYQKQRTEEKIIQKEQEKQVSLPDVETGLNKEKVKVILNYAIELSKTSDYISPSILDDLLYKLSYIQTHIENDQLKFEDKEKDSLLKIIKNLRRIFITKRDLFKKIQNEKENKKIIEKWAMDFNTKVIRSQDSNKVCVLSRSITNESDILKEYKFIGKECERCNKFTPYLKQNEKYCDECVADIFSTFTKQ